MSNNNLDININVNGTDKVKRELSRVTGEISGFSSKTTKLNKNFDKVFGVIKTGAIAAGAAAVAGLGAIVKTGISVASSLETTEAGFKTLLGSTKKARAAMNMIRRDAIKTPFDTLGLARLNQQLTGVTKNAKRSEKIILDVGEAVVGMGRGTEELDRIIVNLQQIGATGRASMIDIRQFAFAGIPIFEMLKKETGLSGDALNKFVSDGKVSFELIEKMFDKANNKGGLFFNAYKNNANTFAQKSAELSESWQNFTADFVTKTGVLDTAREAVTLLTQEMSRKGGLGDTLKSTFQVMKSQEAIKIFKAGLSGLNELVKTTTSSIVLLAAAMGNAKAIEKTYIDQSNKDKKAVDSVTNKIVKDLYQNKGMKTVPKPKPKATPKKVAPPPLPKKSYFLTPFAHGGIVGGNNYYGDKIMARVNSGEMVLTRGQQGALFGLLKNMERGQNINFNAPISFAGNSSPMQQQNTFVNMLQMLQ